MAVIESRLLEAGAAAREDTIADAAASTRRHLVEQQERRAFIHSSLGVKAAEGAFDELCERLATVPVETGNLVTVTPRHYNGIWIEAKTPRELHTVSFAFDNDVINSAEAVVLQVIHELQLRSSLQDPRRRVLDRTDYRFALGYAREPGWKAEGKPFQTSAKLVETVVKAMLSAVRGKTVRHI